MLGSVGCVPGWACSVQFSSIQEGVYALRKAQMCSTPPSLSDVSPTLPLKRFQDRLASFRASLLQAIGGQMSLTLCSQVVSQAPQHLRSFEKQVTCEGCFACQRVCSVISLRSGMRLCVVKLPNLTASSLFFKLCIGLYPQHIALNPTFQLSDSIPSLAHSLSICQNSFSLV